MSPLRSLYSVAIVVLVGGIAGCKDDPPPPKPEPVTSAQNKGNLNLKTPQTPRPTVDPLTTKEYRVESCYFGTLTLRQARDAYFGSLGKDEPSAKKIPSFGSTMVQGPTIAPPPLPATAKDPPGAASPTAKPTTAAAVNPTTAAPQTAHPAHPMSPRIDPHKTPITMAMRAPYERNARSCTIAATMKDPAMAGVDEVITAFAPYALELAKTIATASNYYQREEYKKDDFAKGKELHKKLVADFAKLDAESDKLGSAWSAWTNAHPPNVANADEGQKAAFTAFLDARNLIAALIEKKIALDTYKTAFQKLEASTAALKTYGASNAQDLWSKMMIPRLETLLKALKESETKITEKGVESETFLTIINAFSSLIDAKYQAISRSLLGKNPLQRPGMPIQARPERKPAPNPHQPQEQNPDQDEEGK